MSRRIEICADVPAERASEMVAQAGQVMAAYYPGEGRDVGIDDAHIARETHTSELCLFVSYHHMGMSHGLQDVWALE